MKKLILFISLLFIINTIKAQGVSGIVLGTNFDYQVINNTQHSFTFQTFFSLGYGATCPTLINPTFIIENNILFVKGYYDIRGVWPQAGCDSINTITYNYQMPANITNIITSTNVIKYSSDPSGFTIVENVYTRDFDLSLLSKHLVLKETFKIYPNPTTKTISIDFGQNLASANLVVSNVLGQIVSSKTINNLDKTSLDINESSGVYFLEITNDKLEKQVFKIVKE